MSLSPDGVYLLNKSKGFTSSQEIQRFKKLFDIKKVGHAGTLDKFATGLLIVATGKYTKILEMMLKLDKVYDFTVDFSYLNETLDIYGRETRYLDISINEPLLKRKIIEFMGEIKQRPPLYSAIKVNGKRLSDLARQQIVQGDLQARERLVKIYNLRLLEFNKDKARLMANCSSGTYIRSLGRDLGQKMNAGGVITSLCRRRIGPWSLKKALSLDILKENLEDLSFCRIEDFDLGCLGSRVMVSSEDALNLQRGIHPKEYIRDEPERIKMGIWNNIFMYNSERQLVAIGKNPSLNKKNQKKVCQEEPITKIKVLV